MHVVVTRYRKPDGYQTRYWAVFVNERLLVVTLYRKGAEAVAEIIRNPSQVMNENNPIPEPKQTADQPLPTSDRSVEPNPHSRLDGEWGQVPQVEPETAMKKRRRKGMLRKILGEAPFVF